MTPEERKRIYEEELVRFKAREDIRNKHDTKGMIIKGVLALIILCACIFGAMAFGPYLSRFFVYHILMPGV